MHMYQERRQELAKQVRTLPEAQQNGVIMLLGSFEQTRCRFRQNSTFYYYTGVEEPGAVVLIDLDGASTLYVPQFAGNRAQWLDGVITPDAETAKKLGFQSIQYLGKPYPGYEACQAYERPECEALRQALGTKTIFMPGKSVEPFKAVDIAAIVAKMRRTKNRAEVETMYKAVELTMVAQEAAARCIADGVSESMVQAGIEYVFTEQGARIAFPSIVASGKQSTVLHYHRNNKAMRSGDLVVVDIGAEVDYYCADLTRTYPVSGVFSKRQKEIYTAVLETQDYIASQARPGIWLSNKEKPAESLHHLAVSFLEKKGYAQYFMHGIGHFLGMDVHDVGDGRIPLQEGDVITIEPGIYIAAERIGVRIEDNYWIVKDGVQCLSEALPKSVAEVEELAQASVHDSFEDMADDEYDEGDVQ